MNMARRSRRPRRWEFRRREPRLSNAAIRQPARPAAPDRQRDSGQAPRGGAFRRRVGTRLFQRRHHILELRGQRPDLLGIGGGGRLQFGDLLIQQVGLDCPVLRLVGE